MEYGTNQLQSASEMFSTEGCYLNTFRSKTKSARELSNALFLQFLSSLYPSKQSLTFGRHRHVECFHWRLVLIIAFLICDTRAFQSHAGDNGRFHSLLMVERSVGEPLKEEGVRYRDVRFVSPLLEYGYRPAVEEYENNTLAEKPLLIYLPGFDGTFLSPFLQFPELGTEFDVRCMTIGMKDRSTFVELRDTVIEYLQRLTLDDAVMAEPLSMEQRPFWSLRLQQPVETRRRRLQPRRPIYVAGESFGGILACEVAHQLSVMSSSPSRNMSKTVSLQGVIFINAATCYDRSRLAAEGPIAAQAPSWWYPVAITQLLPLFTDEYSVEQLLLILQSKALPSVIDTAEREAYMGRVAISLPWVLRFMPQATLQWRLSQWLETGCAALTEQKLNRLAAQRGIKKLIIAGELDKTLPSIDEAERLASFFADAVVHVVEGAGHASTCGSRVDLAALCRKAFFKTQKGNTERRTSMKDVARQSTGAYFGMEPRYDNATIGLNPLRYWSKSFYRKYRPKLNK